MRPTAPRAAGGVGHREPQPAEPASLRVGPRLASNLSTEPVAWWERQCPSCNRSFARDVAVCPVDSTPLRRVEVSLPFIWIG